MKKTMRKLIPAIATLLVAVVVMSTASYAWFTISKEAKVTGINMTASAPSSLLVNRESSVLAPATGAPQWANEYDITENGTRYQFGTGALMPSSSLTGLTGTFYAAKDGLDATGAPTATSTWKSSTSGAGSSSEIIALANNVNGHYVDYKLSFKVLDATAPVNVAIDRAKTTVTSTTGNLYNAIRIAVVEAKVTSTVSGYSGAYPTNTDMLYDSDDTNDGSGKIYDGLKNIYSPSADPDAYSGLNGPITNPAAADGWKGVADTNLVGAAGSETTIFSVAKDTVVTITVRIWLEGQDGTCNYDPTTGADQFAILLVFKAIA